MSDIVKAAAEKDARARADRRYFQGTVVSVDKTTHTLVVDVGAEDAQGNSVYLRDIPYDPHTPPQKNDPVNIHYANVSPHSAVVGSGSVGGGNSGQVVQNGAGVSSVAKYGAAKLQGDVTFSAGSNVTLTQTGQNIAISVAGGGGGGTPDEGTKPFGDWVSTNADYTILSTDGIIRCTNNLAIITLTLPNPSGMSGKAVVIFASVSSMGIFVNDHTGTGIYSGTGFVRIIVGTDGTNWYQIN